MKRLFLVILLVMFVAWLMSARMHHPRDFRPANEISRSTGQAHREAQRAAAEAHRAAMAARREANRVAVEARRDAHRVVAEARVEVRQALDEAAHDVREALDEAAQEIRQAVDGIPVPIVPGTRVTEAVAQPPAAPAAFASPEAPDPPEPPVPPEAPGFPGLVKHPGAHPAATPAPKPLLAVKPREIQVITGQVSATEERALDDARKQLEREVTEWLEPHGVPRYWKPAPRQIDAMILETTIKPVIKDQAPYKDYGKLYVAELRVDRSPERLAGFTETYQRQLVQKRMVFLGGALAFILTCLGAVSGYIRADEATKGYYTNRLRMLAAAGVGAAGIAIYQIVA
jgi:hypothetical protein